MVTMYGTTMVSRMGLSILSSVDLEQFCVSNMLDYAARVKQIAEMTADATTALREKIRQACRQSRLSVEIEALLQPLLQESMKP
jgi:predicted O-linked N-acetylglucosamine transferase (SPINDLY family)